MCFSGWNPTQAYSEILKGNLLPVVVGGDSRHDHLFPLSGQIGHMPQEGLRGTVGERPLPKHVPAQICHTGFERWKFPGGGAITEPVDVGRLSSATQVSGSLWRVPIGAAIQAKS